MRTRRMCRNRPVVDDASAPRLLRLHDLDRLLRAQKTAGEVDGDHVVPLLVGQVFHRDGRRAGAGIVEQQVEPPISCRDPPEQSTHRIRLPDIVGTTNVSGPSQAIDAVVRSSSTRRPASTTAHPSPRSPSATARPIPLPAPVTTAIFIASWWRRRPCRSSPLARTAPPPPTINATNAAMSSGSPTRVVFEAAIIPRSAVARSTPCSAATASRRF